MQTTRRIALGATATALFLGGACSGAMDESPEQSKSGYHVVSPGKADNYYSDVAREYELTGTVDVQMDEATYENETERNKKISQRLTAVGLYMTTYLTPKIEGVDSDGSGEIEEDERLFENMNYGGFQTMVRNHSAETVEIKEDGGDTYEVAFSIDVGGPKQLPKMLLDEADGERVEGGVQFSFEMPAGATSNPEDVQRGEIREFDPSEYDGELETVTATADPLPKISNAYPHYDDFMEDGVFGITLFYGHDYTDARHDLEGAKEAFAELEDLGFQPPVESFDELGYESGPFTKTIQRPTAEGSTDVQIQIRIFHSNMFEDARQEQHDLALRELTTRDVFFYNGHAGPYYGFYLDPNGAAQVDPGELDDVEFMEDKQQLFVANGCQTYSQYADMLYANPAKSEENLDAITTVNYSYGRGSMGIVRNLIQSDDRTHEPTAFYDIVSDLNSDWVNRTREVFYGVMGIDGNPQLHPWANPDAIGQSCNTASDCGAGDAHVCVEGRCAAKAIAEGSCPEDTTFGYLGQGEQLKGGICHQ